MRVHELAKKYEKTNKEFLDLIKLWGIEGKSHLSGLTEEEVAIVLDKMEGKNLILKNQKTLLKQNLMKRR